MGMGILEILMGIVIGVISTIATFILVELFAGPELRFKIKYHKKRLSKIIRNPNIKTILTTKTDDLTDKNLDLNKIRETVKNELKNGGFELEYGGKDLKFILGSGKTKIDAEVMFAIEPMEEKVIISGIDANLTASCGYNKFNGYLLDLTAATERIEECLRRAIKDIKFERRSLTCELKNIYELTGVLSGLELSSLVAKIGNQYSIDLFEDKIVAYGNIDQNVASILKKIITVYL